MKLRLPNPGDSKRKFFTRDTVKELIGTNSSPGMNTPGGNLVQDAGLVYGKVAGDAVTDEIAAFTPFVFNGGTPISIGSDNLHLGNALCTGVAHTETGSDTTLWNPTWGIALEYISKSQVGRVQTSGWGWMQTTGMIGTEGNSLEIFNRKLFRCWGGSAKILHQSNGWALVKLGSADMKWVGKTSGSGIALNATGNVTFYEPSGNTFISTSIVLPCITHPSAIVGEKWVEVSIMNGRRVAQEIC